MGKKKNRGKGIFFLFLFLAALAGAFVSLFPLVEKQFPDVAEKVNSFRGYYAGPLFITPETDDEYYFTEEYHGFKSTMEKEQVFYFIPAADINLDFSIYYDDYSDTLSELYLYEADDPESVVGTNINVPYATGRQADSFSQQGAEMPEHANWFSNECSEGILYALKVTPKSSHDIGKDFVVKIEAAEGWVTLQGLWGMFVSLLVILFVVRIIIKFLIWSRRKN